jgi:uncharacterized repeat protein (TIGR01451 family)/LPXTG-motif cell wall-anchored protein
MRARFVARVAAVVVAALVGTLGVVGTSRTAAQTGEWVLTSFCTPTESFPQFRSFRVRNSTGESSPAQLRNQTTNQTLDIVAPPGDSFWLVPARAGANTVILIVDGVQVNVKASNNRVCAALSGNAECDPDVGETTVTWSLKNNNTAAATITNPTGLTFSPNPVPANGTATATTTVVGPATSTTSSLQVEVDLGSGVFTRPSATIDIGACLPPAVVDFTFTKTPSVTTAQVGETVTYTYSGRNTGDVPLEVLELVDDRLGVVLTDPDVDTIVAPGGTISRTVTYVVQIGDAGTTIENNAIVQVRPRPDQGEPGDPLTGVADATVVVPDVPPPVDPTTTTTSPAPTTTDAGVVAPTGPTTVPPTGILPPTGSSTTVAVVAALLVLTGGAILLVRRRASS